MPVVCRTSLTVLGIVVTRRPSYVIEKSDGDEKIIRRIVTDLIAGMTEVPALEVHNRLIGVALGSGLEDLL
jgi:hypothetical protein